MKIFKNLFGTNDKIHGNTIALKEGGTYKTLEGVFNGFIKVETLTSASTTIASGGFLALTINYTIPTGYKMVGYMVEMSGPLESGGYYIKDRSAFNCYYYNGSIVGRTGIPFVNVILVKSDYVDGELMY